MIISVDSSFESLIPHFSLAVIAATVKVFPKNELLRAVMERVGAEMSSSVDLSQIKENPAILHARQAYKRLGKDPNRYRPASEQLSRRVVLGKGLFYINSLVDLGNLFSLQTGYPVGVFDASSIRGDVLLRRGLESDVFEGIGRGLLNIDGLPVYEDGLSPFATPTSDSERTKVRLETTSALVFINHYIPDTNLQKGPYLSPRLSQAADRMVDYLVKYAEAQDIVCNFLLPGQQSVAVDLSLSN
ncbi:MAG: phenylalanine--tRNA ligase beta subunit-related protein [Porphyromonas sp.]|nr:phenylalanine--tRNA ligase beta subunit-related protein [Porphyromonas sp.]